MVSVQYAKDRLDRTLDRVRHPQTGMLYFTRDLKGRFRPELVRRGNRRFWKMFQEDATAQPESSQDSFWLTDEAEVFVRTEYNDDCVSDFRRLDERMYTADVIHGVTDGIEHYFQLH